MAEDKWQRSVSPPATVPQPGETWKHYKGGKYVVVFLSVRESDLQWVVNYSHVQPNDSLSDIVFSRPLSEWFALVNNEFGQLEPRYAKVG